MVCRLIGERCAQFELVFCLFRRSQHRWCSFQLEEQIYSKKVVNWVYDNQKFASWCSATRAASSFVSLLGRSQICRSALPPFDDLEVSSPVRESTLIKLALPLTVVSSSWPEKRTVFRASFDGSSLASEGPPVLSRGLVGPALGCVSAVGGTNMPLSVLCVTAPVH